LKIAVKAQEATPAASIKATAKHTVLVVFGEILEQSPLTNEIMSGREPSKRVYHQDIFCECNLAGLLLPLLPETLPDQQSKHVIHVEFRLPFALISAMRVKRTIYKFSPLLLQRDKYVKPFHECFLRKFK